MKKTFSRLAPVIFVIALIFAMTLTASASPVTQNAANTLHEIGLFQGVGDDADGNPNFDLDKGSTRAEGIVMLIRLLGVEEDALRGNYEHPFTDVPDWAAPYIAYAFAMGYTSGISETEFNPNGELTATQFLTFTLRTLGYDDNAGDFAWDSAWTLTDQLGITNGEFNENNNTFLRSDLAVVSLRTLITPNVEGTTLMETLVEAGVLDSDDVVAFIEALETLVDSGILGDNNLKAVEDAANSLIEGGLISGDIGLTLTDTIGAITAPNPETPAPPAEPPRLSGSTGSSRPSLTNINEFEVEFDEEPAYSNSPPNVKSLTSGVTVYNVTWYNGNIEITGSGQFTDVPIHKATVTLKASTGYRFNNPIIWTSGAGGGPLTEITSITADTIIFTAFYGAQITGIDVLQNGSVKLEGMRLEKVTLSIADFEIKISDVSATINNLTVHDSDSLTLTFTPALQEGEDIKVSNKTDRLLPFEVDDIWNP